MKEVIYKFNRLENELETIPSWVVYELELDIKKRFFSEIGFYLVLFALIPVIVLFFTLLKYPL